MVNKFKAAKQKIHFIKEAHGRRVTQLDPVAMHLMRKHDVIDATNLKIIAREIGSGLSVT